MPTLKVIKSGYNTPKQMTDLIKYIIDEQRHDIRGMVGGSMLITGSVQAVYSQMMDCKKRMNKLKGWNMRHIIISLSDRELEYVDDDKAYMIAMEICRRFFGYQIVFALHHETGRLHMHFGVNTVSYLDGYKLRIFVYTLRAEIQDIFSNYIPPMKMNMSVREYETLSFDELDFLNV